MAGSEFGWGYLIHLVNISPDPVGKVRDQLAFDIFGLQFTVYTLQFYFITYQSGTPKTRQMETEDGASVSSPSSHHSVHSDLSEISSDPSYSYESPVDSDLSPPCSICLQPCCEPSHLNTCAHMFCFNCIFLWTQHSGSPSINRLPTCPLCKQEYQFWAYNVREEAGKFEKYFWQRKSIDVLSRAKFKHSK
jgi:hypothetical protein